MNWFLSCIRPPHHEEHVMAKTKPMSYQSLKCIIQHMDANKRFLCASHLPSLRNIHKATPLKIEVLKLEPASFTVNHMEYSFVSIVEENVKQCQKSHENVKWAEYIEGKPFDVNQFGLEDTVEDLTQGDILIEAQRQYHLNRMENKMRFVSHVRMHYLLPKRRDEYQQAKEEYKQAREGNRQQAKEKLQKAKKILQEEEKQEDRRRNPIKCISYTCCTVTNKTNNSRMSLRLPYGIKIRDVLRQQIQNLCSGRRVLQVKRLEIDNETGLWRLPHQIKLNVQELGVRGFASEMIESVKPILDKKSFPLKHLSIEVRDSDDLIFQNEILTTLESLHIKCDTMNSLADVLINLTNKEIYFSGLEILLSDIVFVARNWIEKPRCIGTRFSVKPTPVHKFFIELVKQLGAIKVNVKISACYVVQGFTVPINETSELNIYCWISPNYEEEMTKEIWLPMVIVMEIMPIGSAKHRN